MIVFVPIFGFIVIFITYQSLSEHQTKLVEKKHFRFLGQGKDEKPKKPEFDSDLYVKINPNHLPFKQYSEKEIEKNYKKLHHVQNKVKKYMKLPMVHFNKEYSNEELKEKFGSRNLDNIILFEEHFKRFVNALYEWSHALNKKGEKEEALVILEQAVALQANTSNIYLLLSDLYIEQEDIYKLKLLQKKMKTTNIYAFDKINDYIEKSIHDIIKGRG